MSSFLSEPESTPATQALYDGDLEGDGYVMNLTRVWAHHPQLMDTFSALAGQATEAGGLTFRQRGVLVSATAAARGDSYCSLAWGARLASASDPAVAASVLRGTDEGLDESERVMAAWARKVVRDPNGTTPDDVQALRDAGFDDAQIMAMTLYVTLRLAFSSVNGALGARPDKELGEAAPAEVTGAVDYGRPVAD